jgi:hypothetical protein
LKVAPSRQQLLALLEWVGRFPSRVVEDNILSNLTIAQHHPFGAGAHKEKIRLYLEDDFQSNT